MRKILLVYFFNICLVLSSCNLQSNKLNENSNSKESLSSNTKISESETNNYLENFYDNKESENVFSESSFQSEKSNYYVLEDDDILEIIEIPDKPFVQGVEILDDKLLLATGLVGDSRIGYLEAGVFYERARLESPYFGEGITAT